MIRAFGSRSRRWAVCIAAAAGPCLAACQARTDDAEQAQRTDAGVSAAGRDSGPALPALCSGCASETPAPTDMSLHVHHVHMNVADRARASEFYAQFFSAEQVALN